MSDRVEEKIDPVSHGSRNFVDYKKMLTGIEKLELQTFGSV